MIKRVNKAPSSPENFQDCIKSNGDSGNDVNTPSFSRHTKSLSSVEEEVRMMSDINNSSHLGANSQPSSKLEYQKFRPNTAKTLKWENTEQSKLSSYIHSAYVNRRPQTSPVNPFYYSISTSRHTVSTHKHFSQKVLVPMHYEPQQFKRYVKNKERVIAHLPAVESRHMIQDKGGRLFVRNCQNKSIIRNSNELLTSRKMGFIEGKATST